MTDPLTQWLDETETKAQLASQHSGNRWYADHMSAALPPETVEALLECVRALEYYAECSNYERREMLGGTRPPAVLVERGSRATAALARLRALTGREG